MNFTRKDWLYVFGAVASLVAIAYLLFKVQGKNLNFGAQAVTDATPPTSATPGVGYLNYNMPELFPTAPIPSGADMSAPPNQYAGCGCSTDCAGSSSPLATGDNTFADLNALLTYYQNTNPIYVELQKVQLQRYAAFFATGESYARGGVPLGVAAIG